MSFYTVDHRNEFSKWFTSEFKNVIFPSSGTVFDVYVDNAQQELVSWDNKVPKFELDPDMPLQAVLVHTGETIRIKFFLDLLVDKRNPVMMIGSAGCGKTVCIK